MSFRNQRTPAFRDVLAEHGVVRAAGAHHALGARIAQDAGFEAVWSSSLEVAAAQCLPDSSLLTMTEHLSAARSMQRYLDIPVIADCDTGYGDPMNVVHLVREFESAGITAICIEDKTFPKSNSFVKAEHRLVSAEAFARKIRAAKRAQRSSDFFVIARTESLINGQDVLCAVKRCLVYAEAGADAVLVQSKHFDHSQISEFLAEWNAALPVIIVPTAYPDWTVEEAEASGVDVIIYANHGVRATVAALRQAFDRIINDGCTRDLEGTLATIADIFKLQNLQQWEDASDR